MARKRREIPVVHVKERSNGRFAYFFEGIKVNGKRTQISKGGFASSEEALAAGEIAIVKYYFGGQAQIAHAVEAMKNNSHLTKPTIKTVMSILAEVYILAVGNDRKEN